MHSIFSFVFINHFDTAKQALGFSVDKGIPSFTQFITALFTCNSFQVELIVELSDSEWTSELLFTPQSLAPRHVLSK